MEVNKYYKKYKKYRNKYNQLAAGESSDNIYFIIGSCIKLSSVSPDMRSKIDILTKNHGVDNDELGHITAYIRLASGQNRLNTSNGSSSSGSGSDGVGIDMNIFNRRSDELIDNIVNANISYNIFKSIIKNYLYNKYAVIFYGRSDQLLSTSKHTCDSLLLLRSYNLYDLINPNKIIELLGYTAPYNLHNIKRDTLLSVNILSV